MINIPDHPSDDIKTFLICFMRIIWGKIWSDSNIYSTYNNISLNYDIVLKTMKYHIFSEGGILISELKPYIIKAMEDGFLMPKFYKQNNYVESAIQLYKSAYEIVKTKDRDKEIKFIINNNIPANDIDNNKIIDKNNLCTLIDSWDINLNLIYSKDKFQNVTMLSLMQVLKDISFNKDGKGIQSISQ